MRNRCSVVVALSLLLAACGSGPDTTAKKFAEAVDSGRSAEALDLMDPSLKQVAGAKLPGRMAEVARKVQGKGGIKQAEVLSTAQNGDYATVSVQEDFGDGTTARGDMKLRKVDGKWYVTM